MATLNNNGNNSDKKANAKSERTEALAKLEAVNKAESPQPTQLMGGLGEFYYFPKLAVYAPLVGEDQPGDFRLTEDQWVMMKPMLLPCSDSVKRAAEQAAAERNRKRVYRLSIDIELDGNGDCLKELASANPRWLKCRLLEGITNPENVTISLLTDSLKGAKRPKGVGAVATGERRAPEKGGANSGYRTAKSKDDFPLFNLKKWKVIQDLAAGKVVKFSDYALYGYEKELTLKNDQIGLQQAGFGGCLENVKGTGFRLKSGMPYEGFAGDHVMVKG